MNTIFFQTPAEFQEWLAEHHETSQELQVGFYKKGSGKPTITWPEAVDEALCFGWIDGVRKSIDDTSYTIRFTPRKAQSIWSAVNVARVAALAEQGRMQPAGLKAFEKRNEAKTAIYSHEQGENVALADADEQQFRANEQAWTFFQAQPGSYRKAAIWWVVSAKQETTQRKRLATLIDDSANGRTLKQFTRPKK